MITPPSQISGYLTGKLLVSVPFSVSSSPFAHSVIFICGHDAHGAIGLVINKSLTTITFADFLQQFNIQSNMVSPDKTLHYGGPVEISRGFVLHSPDYQIDSTVMINKRFGITSTIEVLRSIANNQGPDEHLVILGYAGWSAGQLEQEIQDNEWIIADPEEDIIFHLPIEERWQACFQSMGIDPLILSWESGHA